MNPRWLAASVVAFRTTKNPSPFSPMLVEIPVAVRLPWMVLVSCEKAPTDPLVCFLTGSSATRSTKLVSIRL